MLSLSVTHQELHANCTLESWPRIQSYTLISHSYLHPVCSQASPMSQQPCISPLDPTVLKITTEEPTELCLTVITVAVGAAFLCLLILTVVFPLAVCICIKHRVSGRSPKHRVKIYHSREVAKASMISNEMSESTNTSSTSTSVQQLACSVEGLY